ncbi:MAG: hypothetical protein A2735_00425 [Candidatus Yanofskybacteria bacterium RIFCSPHIGHO2_01_FULL_41_21]|uniref:Uncharacterized protein n=2 Tax=Candidatus Yanofskyibacteriota TaxID=1752733 RepID=A0A0G0WKQ2_9BACT|nr:MAG: hypothetical protein UU70_C0016G0005 [Candidatus Yanofskybacteria bacterium GW2011_GWA1_41_6]OGM98159.1 MAG: hypothetical protein A2735_00425 [Candidatus Yanofskybacteria bacterium RIFCSPHIGHO2_01_FULL_41_21]
MIKNTYIYLIVVAAVVGGVIFLMNRDNKTDNIGDTSDLVSSSSEPVQSLVPTPTPTPTPKLTKSTPKPSPKIIITEVNQYQFLVDWLDPLNRRLTLDRDCTSIVPSQVAYPNNTQIMLDNTFSPKAQVIKIGTKEYSVTANGWLLVTLVSSELPAKLTMFCGSMELGQLDLQ